MPETKPEIEPKIEICDLCREPVHPPEGSVLECLCAERYGHILLNAHREYQENEAALRAGQEGAELLPVCIVTRFGARLNVDGGLEISSPEKLVSIVLLHDVAADFLDLEMNLHFDQAEIRLDEISWVGFNLP